ncbi:MAG: DEAD/DEAH box helicase family protein [Anaerolineae bacterium]|nr:DEAD/DEAH box helicase family protein [Anaerolineae bacterium]
MNPAKKSTRKRRTTARKTAIPYQRALPEVPGRNPHTKPDAYLEKLGEGDYAVRQGRRPSTMFLVNKLRRTVDRWRNTGYPDTSEVTRRLFQYWFDEDHPLPNQEVWRYWWCQREAIETLVYLVEVKGYTDLVPVIKRFGEKPKGSLMGLEPKIETTMDGVRQLRRWVPEVEKDAIQELPEKNLLRYAFKIATGAGKTEVMAMVIVWSYFHRCMVSDSPMADNFLVVAPNVIVYERLERDFASGKIFYEHPLIPPEWRKQWNVKVILRGDSAMPAPGGNLFVVNIQQIYESRSEEWTPDNAVQAILGRPPSQDLASYQPSMLDRIKGLGNLAVLNDEAHHVHDDDLAWNQTLLALHENLKRKSGRGLTLWLDFSATPKTQGGTYYPWIIVDYPLAQAIEDQIVKAPLIVHRVDKKDPVRVTKSNVVQAYHDWIVVALERWKEHFQVYRQVGQKPVLFIMAERTTYADAIAEHVRKHARLRKSEVLVIHTNAQGKIYENDLDSARQVAAEVDKPDSEVKIIVSVLMLREGWDVKNVTVILGLRPFTAAAKILPEQAVGRGLRLMPNISPDSRQTLEVIGTAAFEEFVRELEQEGVGIDTVADPPPKPIIIYPVQEKAQYDIAIPLTKPRYLHEYRDLDELDPLQLPPIYEADVLEEQTGLAIKIAFATTETVVHDDVIQPEEPLLSQDFLSDIAHTIERRLQLSGHFAELYAIVKRYVQQKCFGVPVDLDSTDIGRRLRDPELQKGIADFLSRQIAQLATRERDIEFEDAAFRLSQTKRFTWHRQHIVCERTVFNECAIYNDLERRFAEFLDQAPAVLRFAALAESYTRFRVDYLSEEGAIRFYYPDFVAVQQVKKGEVNWIIETKGWERGDVAHKDASIRQWCERISAQTGQRWCYLKVPQVWFDEFVGQNLNDLVGYLQVEESKPLLVAEA